MLRSYGKDVQNAFITQTPGSQPAKMFFRGVFNSIFQPEAVGREAACYHAWCQHQKDWYVGKCNVLRKRVENKLSISSFPGVVGRFQEHVCATRLQGALRTETKYMKWKNAHAYEFCFVLTCWGNESDILSYERSVINRNQAPMQVKYQKCNSRPSRHRPHARFRQRPSIDDELSFNFCHAPKKRHRDDLEA